MNISPSTFQSHPYVGLVDLEIEGDIMRGGGGVSWSGPVYECDF